MHAIMSEITANVAKAEDEAPEDTNICDVPSLVEEPNGYQISLGMDGAI